MALVPLPPAPLSAQDTHEATPDHHINRRKGHEKIILDSLKRKIVRKGMLKTKASTNDHDQNDQDDNAATT